MNAPLVLRDIHQPPAPPWWPPAPGWWCLAALLLVALAVAAWRYWRRRRRAQALARLFDAAVAVAESPAAEVAALSDLLRRAARKLDPHADKLAGEDWLRFLERAAGAPLPPGGAGLLREGAYRPAVDAAGVQ
ncbi:MAG: DUF4381 family protein, partial [Lysobacteraceae bacterium]